MATGSHHHVKPKQSHWRELGQIEKQSWFQRGLAIPKTLVRTSEIPWLGGSSTDLRHIYTDPRFRGPARYNGRVINVSVFVPAIIQHEGIESILLILGTDSRGARYSYDAAHELATAAELAKARRIIEALGLRFESKAYQDIFTPFLRITEKPPWQNLPSDLNLEPYRQDDSALYRELEKAVLRRQIERVA